jgi:hypothetical protein
MDICGWPEPSAGAAHTSVTACRGVNCKCGRRTSLDELQVSGRSDLTWEESVRLDLRYVEDWTLTSDIFIAFKTLSVMVRRAGAY